MSRPVTALRSGDLIPTELCGPLLVLVVDADITAVPELDRVYVDVEVRNSGPWDADLLAAAVGAEDRYFLSLTPALRYRLAFLPAATVPVMDGEATAAWHRDLKQWRTEPARRAEARGHKVIDDTTRTQRFTCTLCGRAALRSGATIYGSAVEVDCDGKEQP